MTRLKMRLGLGNHTGLGWHFSWLRRNGHLSICYGRCRRASFSLLLAILLIQCGDGGNFQFGRIVSIVASGSLDDRCFAMVIYREYNMAFML